MFRQQDERRKPIRWHPRVYRSDGIRHSPYPLVHDRRGYLTVPRASWKCWTLHNVVQGPVTLGWPLRPAIIELSCVKNTVRGLGNFDVRKSFLLSDAACLNCLSSLLGQLLSIKRKLLHFIAYVLCWWKEVNDNDAEFTVIFHDYFLSKNCNIRWFHYISVNIYIYIFM